MVEKNLYDDDSLNYENANGNKQIRGRSAEMRLSNIETKVYRAKSPLTPANYAKVIAEWLRINPTKFSILDFYEDDDNLPFHYPLKTIVELHSPELETLLEQRIAKAGLEKIIQHQFAAVLLQNKFGWVKEQTQIVDVKSNEPIKFNFGE